MRFNPFEKVTGKYGAPMGRGCDAPGNFVDAPVLYAKHQGGGQGYDRGGAYWGTPCNVWAVWTRAWSREEAIAQARDL